MDNVQAETSTPDAAPPVATAPSANVERLCEWDRCAPLSGRQKRFASDRCRYAFYDHNHPRLATPPVVPDGRSIDRLVAIAADGRYRSVVELAHETGCNPMTVYRRIRESVTGRKGRKLARFAWVSRPRAHRGRSRILEYALVLNPEAA